MLAWLRNHVLVAAALALLLVPALARASTGSVGYEYKRAAGTPVHVVTANLNDPDVHVGLVVAANGIGSNESFRSMLRRARPTAAITGTYFGVSNLQPTGDLVIKGQRVHRGCIGTAICFTSDNRVFFRPHRPGCKKNYEGCEVAVEGGPRLLSGGELVVDPRAEGFRDPALFRRNPRTAIGLTAGNKLLLVAVTRPVYLSDLARAMKDLGAVDAVSLDGGSSTALWYRGKLPATPRRALTHIFAVYDSQYAYDKWYPGLTEAVARTSEGAGSKS
jgi:exopolysaccharide biosynthesis protein